MILDDIIAATKIRVEKAKKAIPLEEMKRAALALPITQEFPFEKALTGDGIRFICECKKASPSKGVIVEDFPYLEIAKDYEGKLKVCKLNIDENQETPPKYGVRGIPTLMLFKNGNVEATKVGALSKSQLMAFLDSNI